MDGYPKADVSCSVAYSTTTGPTSYTAGYSVGFGGQFGYYVENNAKLSTDSRDRGLILAMHRYYDPINARWLTRDPIGYDGDINLYGYVTGISVMESDPSGLQSDDDDTLYLSPRQLYRKAGNDFRNEPMWKAGSKERRQYATAMESVIPGADVASAGYQTATGKNLLSGANASRDATVATPALATVHADDLKPKTIIGQSPKQQGTSFKELRNLVSKWGKGAFHSVSASIRRHTDEKGFGTNNLRYLRKSMNFNKKGAKNSGLRSDGTILWTRVDGSPLIERGKIVSCTPPRQ
ncbi:MAG: hypothetical protein H7145_16210 [Akkermansiaceae bacterium]|nr:hypothetical protein [Armatimonadota bacterium]